MLSKKTLDKIDELIYGLCNSLVDEGKKTRSVDPEAIDAITKLIDSASRLQISQPKVVSPTINIDANFDKSNVDEIIKIIAERLEKEVSDKSGVYT